MRPCLQVWGLFFSYLQCQRIHAGKGRVKNSLVYSQGPLAQKARDLQSHRYTLEVWKKKTGNGFRVRCCRLVINFFLLGKFIPVCLQRSWTSQKLPSVVTVEWLVNRSLKVHRDTAAYKSHICLNLLKRISFVSELLICICLSRF